MRFATFSFAAIFTAQRAHAACSPSAEFGCLPVSLFSADGHDARLRYAPEFAMRAPWSWSGGLDVHGALDPLRVSPNNPSTPESAEALVHERLEATLRGSTALSRAWVLHLAAPLVLGQSGVVGARSGARSPVASQAFGDARVGVAFRAHLAPRVSFASRVSLALPTASENAYAGSRAAVLSPDVSIQVRPGIVVAYLSARARTELTDRAPHDAPTTWAGAALGVQFAPWGQALAFHSEFLGYTALNTMAPYAQDRSGGTRTDLPGQRLVPLQISAGASSRGLLCSACTVHASIGSSPSSALAPAVSGVLRFEFVSERAEGGSQ